MHNTFKLNQLDSTIILQFVIYKMGAQNRRQMVSDIPNVSNIQNILNYQHSINISDSSFLQGSLQNFQLQNKPKIFKIPQFKRLIGWELQLEGVPVEQLPTNNVLYSSNYFNDKKGVDIYLGALFGLKQICDLNIFQNVEINAQKSPFSVTTKQTLSNIPRIIDRKQLKQNVDKFLDLLIFLSKLLQKTQNLYIQPLDIVQTNGMFYLRGFFSKEYNKSKLILAYITWLYEEFQNFQEGLSDQIIFNFSKQANAILKQIYFSVKNQKINCDWLVSYLIQAKSKNYYLAGNFDSFLACFKSTKVKQLQTVYKEWILAKRQNQIYFCNIQDHHVCQGRVIRKKRKIPMQNVNLIFDPDDFQVIFALEGTRNVVKTPQFQLENSFTISDIQIKYKLPFKLRNPMIFLRGKSLYLLDQMVFRYSTDLNIIYQQSKKINDSIYLASSSEWNFMVIKLSIDIFKRGIEIYIGDNLETLYPSGNLQLVSQIQSIKMDIKIVQFCLEVYKGIYLMLANNNLWILDINFMCFFSFAPIDRVNLYSKGKINLNEGSEFMFQIVNQPFTANWLSNHGGINVSIKEDYMNVIASVRGKLFYLQYRFIFQAGILRLINYRPLFNEQTQILEIAQKRIPPFKQYTFNVYNENLQYYKQNLWLYKGPQFLQVSNIKINSYKAFSEVLVETEETLCSLKEMIQENKRTIKNWNPTEIALLLHKIFYIYNGLWKNNIPHKNFNLNNIWVTKKKQIKLSGWSQPSKNWHISDFKDFLLTCFNVIVQNDYDKITDKIMEKHEKQLKQFPFLQQKLHISLRVKLAERRNQIQKNLSQIKQQIYLQLFKVVQKFKSDNLIFSFQKNTPRFSMVGMSDLKIKKMTAILESNDNREQFTFKQKDVYVWDEKRSCLYIFTPSYQMFEIKINTADYKDQTFILEQFQYLPHNIVYCSFINSPEGLFAFGGIARSSSKKVNYNKGVYLFCRQTLTWISVAEFSHPRLNPYLALSESNQHIYIMGGELEEEKDVLQFERFDTATYKLQRLLDQSLSNPLKRIGDKQSVKFFQISQRYNIFLIYSVDSTRYSLNIFSNIICGFQINVKGKINVEQYDNLPQVSMALVDGHIHFLRPYGKYTKISMGYFQNSSVYNKTLYSN